MFAVSVFGPKITIPVLFAALCVKSWDVGRFSYGVFILGWSETGNTEIIYGFITILLA